MNLFGFVMLVHAQESAYIPEGTTLNFDAILPKDRSYVTYEGSLTTPPCTGEPTKDAKCAPALAYTRKHG